jgi:hypothetical protein
MPLSIVTAHIHLRSKAAYTQSRKYEEAKLEGEQPDDYDRRNWRKHLHVKQHHDGRQTVFIPGRAVHFCLIDAAKYSMRKISANYTWTKKFESGIAIPDDLDLGIDPAKVDFIDINAHSNGKRGSASRVTRRLPIIPAWQADFVAMILDPIITEDVFHEMLEIGGLFIGLGQNRPQNGGSSGRFEIVAIDWNAALQPVRKAA